MERTYLRSEEDGLWGMPLGMHSMYMRCLTCDRVATRQKLRYVQVEYADAYECYWGEVEAQVMQMKKWAQKVRDAS